MRPEDRNIREDKRYCPSCQETPYERMYQDITTCPFTCWFAGENGTASSPERFAGKVKTGLCG